MITVVHRPAEDGLSREYWEIEIFPDGSTLGMRLASYGIQRRSKPNRGSFRSPEPKERWSWIDERRYYSGLPRPETLPEDVAREALDRIAVTLYVGWKNADSRTGEIKLVEKK